MKKTIFSIFIILFLCGIGNAQINNGIYIADYYNQRIALISPNGGSGSVSTYLDLSTQCGDPPCRPTSIAFNSDKTVLYILIEADTGDSVMLAQSTGAGNYTFLAKVQDIVLFVFPEDLIYRKEGTQNILYYSWNYGTGTGYIDKYNVNTGAKTSPYTQSISNPYGIDMKDNLIYSSSYSNRYIYQQSGSSVPYSVSIYYPTTTTLATSPYDILFGPTSLLYIAGGSKIYIVDSTPQEVGTIEFSGQNVIGLAFDDSGHLFAVNSNYLVNSNPTNGSIVYEIGGSGGKVQYYSNAAHGYTLNGPWGMAIKGNLNRAPSNLGMTLTPSKASYYIAEKIQFTGNATDADLDTLTYEWDFDNNGTYEKTGITQTDISFNTPATYTVKLRVTDGPYGGVTTYTQNVVVANRTPIAAVTNSPSGSTFYVGAKLKFDGTTSYDLDSPYDSIVAYKWTMGGETLSNSPFFEFTFWNTGVFNIQLEVTDQYGGKGTKTTTITIQGAPNISVSDNLLYFGSVAQKYTKEATLSITNNGTQNLTITNMTRTNPVFDLFPSTGFTLEPGKFTVITVLFTPSSIDRFNDLLTITSNDPDGSPLNISLIGYGIADGIPPEVGRDTLVYPNGGEYLAGGNSYNISWIPSKIQDPNIGTNPISLFYTTDGTSFNSIVTGLSNAGGVYSWTIPNTINSNSVKIKLTATDLYGNSTSDLSDNFFNIDSTLPSSTESSPSQGEIVKTKPILRGSALDSGTYASGVISVGVSIYENATSLYYDSGTNSFISPTEIFLPTVGTSSWSYDTAAVPFIDGRTYRYRSQAIDRAGNKENASSKTGKTFTYSSIKDPDIDVVPLVVDFGMNFIGTVTERVVTIKNIGPGQLTITGLNEVDIDGVFKGIATLPIVLSEGEEYLLSVQFYPHTQKTFTGELKIVSNDPDEGIITINLSGRASTRIAFPAGVYVVERGKENGRVVLLDNQGRFIQKIVDNLGTTSTLIDVAYDASTIYVVKGTGGGLWKILPDGSKTAIATSLGTIKGVEVGYDGYLYVTVGNTVAKLNSNGNIVTSNLITGLSGPYDLKFGQDGLLYIAELNEGRISRWNINETPAIKIDNYLTDISSVGGISFDSLGNLATVDFDENIVIIKKTNGDVQTINVGSGPIDLDFSQTNEIYVSEITQNRISLAYLDNFVTSFNLDALLNPAGIVVVKEMVNIEAPCVVQAGSNVNLKGLLNENLTGTITYWWDYGDGSVEYKANPGTTHFYETEGSYLITLTVTGKDRFLSPQYERKTIATTAQINILPKNAPKFNKGYLYVTERSNPPRIARVKTDGTVERLTLDRTILPGDHLSFDETQKYLMVEGLGALYMIDANCEVSGNPCKVYPWVSGVNRFTTLSGIKWNITDSLFYVGMNLNGKWLLSRINPYFDCNITNDMILTTIGKPIKDLTVGIDGKIYLAVDNAIIKYDPVYNIFEELVNVISPISIAINRARDYAFVSTSDKKVLQINLETGNKTTLLTEPTLSSPQGVALNRLGNLLYIADDIKNSIFEYNIFTGTRKTVTNTLNKPWKITAELLNSPPISSITLGTVGSNQGTEPNSLKMAENGTTLTFDGSGSYDPDGDVIAYYLWDFGDGTSIKTTSPYVTHTFISGTPYIISLIVNDGELDSEPDVYVYTTPYPCSMVKDYHSYSLLILIGLLFFGIALFRLNIKK